MKYFIADTHFGEERILKFEHRPFDTVEEMNGTIISNCNKVVKATDELYILGDIGDISQLYMLKGKLTVITGNHDDYDKLYEQLKNTRIYVSKYPIIIDYMILSHEPVQFIPPEMPYINLHGHLHRFQYTRIDTDLTWDSGNRYFCCSVDEYNSLSVYASTHKMMLVTEFIISFVKNLDKFEKYLTKTRRKAIHINKAINFNTDSFSRNGGVNSLMKTISNPNDKGNIEDTDIKVTFALA